MKIHNTITRQKEEFKPIKEKKIGIYVCGPTVYGEPHIGHARSAYIFDYITAYLKYRGFKVKFVRNVTDVDDKIINKAKEQKDAEDLKQATKLVADKFLAKYHEDMDTLGIRRPDVEPKATEHIKNMIKTISLLIEKEYAYEAGGDVYYSVRKFANYGKLSNQSLDKMEIGARIAPGENKKDPLDFALWKKAKEGEPSWPSPWGEGRPGWHIECSVMSTHFLGENFDIHGGGIDLIFPHHENEIAQAQGFENGKFANYWIHNGLLTINSEKMSKSLGNFISIKDFLASHSSDILKVFFLSAHYRSPIDFTDEKINEAKKEYERINILMRKLDRMFGTRQVNTVVHGGAGEMGEFHDKFIEYMDDDFNTPKALSVLFDMVNRCNRLLDSNEKLKNQMLNHAMEIIKEIADVFGLDFLKERSGEISDNEIKFKMATREALRKNKKYKEADEVRKALEEKGIIIEDTKEGVTWRRKIS